MKTLVACLALLSACGAKTELGVADGDEAAGGGGSSSLERRCLPNCTVGHQCCVGSCSGPPVAMKNDCCACLPGEVNSMLCQDGRCE